MEQQEEDIEQIQIKRRRQSSSASSFPQDLISEILLKLPVKSIARFRCVSKLWSSITTDRYFTNTFKTQNPKSPSVLLLSFRRKDKLFVFSIPSPSSSSSSSHQPVESYHIPYPKHRSFSPEESVHGLFCFPNASSENPVIWNPTTRKFVTLPKPEKFWKHITCFLGYDPIEGKHKVVCMPFDKHKIDEYCVLTLGLGLGKKSWRKIKTSHEHRLSINDYECVDGVLYYRAKTDALDVIMSFDVRSEKLGMIKVPWIYDIGGGVLITYKGKLAYVKFTFNSPEATLWILKDAEKHDWSCLHVYAYLHQYDSKLKMAFHFSGVTDAGEFVYLPSWFRESFCVIYYDPKRRSCRKVEFKGIADGEFRRKHGLGTRRFLKIHTVLNHIESLISL